jgi:hypothetical protein
MGVRHNSPKHPSRVSDRPAAGATQAQRATATIAGFCAGRQKQKASTCVLAFCFRFGAQERTRTSTELPAST